jgi:hypothetical protein
MAPPPQRPWWFRLLISVLAGVSFGVPVAITLTIADLYLSGHGYRPLSAPLLSAAALGIHLSLIDLLSLVATVLAAAVTWRRSAEGGADTTTAALQLLLVAALITYFGNLFLRHLNASVGTITADAIVVQPGRLWGVRLAGPAGRVPIHQFEAVRVERIFPPVGVQGRWHERVCLVGRDGIPDIVIARTALDAGRVMGNELATALKLPYQEQLLPY